MPFGIFVAPPSLSFPARPLRSPGRLAGISITLLFPKEAGEFPEPRRPRAPEPLFRSSWATGERRPSCHPARRPRAGPLPSPPCRAVLPIAGCLPTYLPWARRVGGASLAQRSEAAAGPSAPWPVDSSPPWPLAAGFPRLLRHEAGRPALALGHAGVGRWLAPGGQPQGRGREPSGKAPHRVTWVTVGKESPGRRETKRAAGLPRGVGGRASSGQFRGMSPLRCEARARGRGQGPSNSSFPCFGVVLVAARKVCKMLLRKGPGGHFLPPFLWRYS